MSIGKILNPIQHIKDAIHGVKSLAHGDIMGALDPGNALGMLGGAMGGKAGGGGGAFNYTPPQQLPRAPLTPGSFPTSGFANSNALQYLMQVLGPSFAQPPAAGAPPMQAGGAGGLIKMQPAAQPGPVPNPLAQLAQFAGPMGNGGGYLTGRAMVPTPVKRAVSGWGARH